MDYSRFTNFRFGGHGGPDSKTASSVNQSDAHTRAAFFFIWVFPNKCNDNPRVPFSLVRHLNKCLVVPYSKVSQINSGLHMAQPVRSTFQVYPYQPARYGRHGRNAFTCTPAITCCIPSNEPYAIVGASAMKRLKP